MYWSRIFQLESPSCCRQRREPRHPQERPHHWFDGTTTVTLSFLNLTLFTSCVQVALTSSLRTYGRNTSARIPSGTIHNRQLHVLATTPPPYELKATPRSDYTNHLVAISQLVHVPLHMISINARTACCLHRRCCTDDSITAFKNAKFFSFSILASSSRSWRSASRCSRRSRRSSSRA